MDKLETAKSLLGRINMPLRQQSTLCCLTLLAMAHLKEDTPWAEATNEWIRIHDIISFIAEYYGVKYAENSRETFRKQVIHPFKTAALIEDNGLSTNSPNFRYRITSEFLTVICSVKDNCDSDKESDALIQFLRMHDTLSDIYASKKKMQRCLSESITRILHLVRASTISCRKPYWKSLRHALLLILNVCMWGIPLKRI